jgi:rhodanese-related sulfurtransferase
MLNNKHNITAKVFYDIILANQNEKTLAIIDIRTKDEFNGYHISNAVNIDFYSQHFTETLDALDRYNTYLIYCRSGHRSGTVTENALDLMLNLGFANVYNMRGGILSFINVPGSDDFIE